MFARALYVLCMDNNRSEPFLCAHWDFPLKISTDVEKKITMKRRCNIFSRISSRKIHFLLMRTQTHARSEKKAKSFSIIELFETNKCQAKLIEVNFNFHSLSRCFLLLLLLHIVWKVWEGWRRWAEQWSNTISLEHRKQLWLLWEMNTTSAKCVLCSPTVFLF